ncbi:hypothetical protein ES705_44292 [subsurface metagenome]
MEWLISVKNFFEFYGFVSTFILTIILIVGIVLWFKGILPVLFRLGHGLAKGKIAIFAKGDNLNSLKSLLLDSELFSEKNLVEIRSNNDFGKSEKSTLFLIFWYDWGERNIDEILNKKTDKTALVVYAPRDKGVISKKYFEIINKERNVSIANLRGRLLNDIVSSLITTSYENK